MHGWMRVLISGHQSFYEEHDRKSVYARSDPENRVLIPGSERACYKEAMRSTERSGNARALHGRIRKCLCMHGRMRVHFQKSAVLLIASL